MKKPTKPTRTNRNPHVPVSPKSPRSGHVVSKSTGPQVLKSSHLAPSPSTTAPGILSADVVKGKGGIEAVVVRLAPHHLVIITGGAKPTVSLACTHHGFVAEAYELNGQLEQVINHVRKHFPKLRVD